MASWSRDKIPQAGMSVADLPEGVYNIGSFTTQQLTNLPNGIEGGRTVIITSGTVSTSEKVILLMNSRSGSLFFGYMYGVTLNWKKVDFTV